MTVEDAKSSVSHAEFYDWRLFFLTNPPLREHISNVGALIANTVYNCAQGKKKRLKFKDFKIDYREAVKTDNEKLMDSFKQFEHDNASIFEVK